MPHKHLSELHETYEYLVFLDFDGTLVEIADKPSLVKIPPLLIKILLNISNSFPTHIISGRTLCELESFLPLPRLNFSAEHGAVHKYGNEIKRQTDIGREVDTMIRRTSEMLGNLAKDILEVKECGIALHYRKQAHMRDGLLQLARHVIEPVKDEFSIIEGKQVYEIRHNSINKGFAIEWWLKKYDTHRSHVPIFIGDDATDEDGFDVVNHSSGISIHVGNNPNTKAKYTVKNVDSVLDILKWINGWIGH